VNSRVVYTSGSVTRWSEREVAVLCALVRAFINMSKQSTFDSFDTELFITEIEKLIAIWDSRSSAYKNKQEETHAWETLCKKCTENYFFFIQVLLCINASVRTSSSDVHYIY
jgi:hypothetical protein